MMRDLTTVVWKEWRELLAGAGGRAGAMRMVIGLSGMGVVFPVRGGPAFLLGWQAALGPVLLACMIATAVAADAFAGERERHTLETLLATRLPDGAVLLGKVAGIALWSWAHALALLPVSLVAVNVAFRDGAPHGYAATPLALAVLGGLVGAVLVAALGVLVSLRADGVRQAQQALGLAVVALFMGPLLVWRVLPAGGRDALARAFAGATPATLGWSALGAGTAAAALLVAVALLRFRRTRLSFS